SGRGILGPPRVPGVPPFSGRSSRRHPRGLGDPSADRLGFLAPQGRVVERLQPRGDFAAQGAGFLESFGRATANPFRRVLQEGAKLVVTGTRTNQEESGDLEVAGPQILSPEGGV